jgi:hypothetical protein
MLCRGIVIIPIKAKGRQMDAWDILYQQTQKGVGAVYFAHVCKHTSEPHTR